jgi:hypothetical protein
LGAAIVSYDFEMNPFVVRPGHDEAVLVPFRDVAALAKETRCLLSDPERARRYRTRARASARARFSEEAARAAERAVAARLLSRVPGAASFDTWQLDWEMDESRDRHTAA